MGPVISETELEVLKVLWERRSGTVREIAEDLRGRGRDWAYTTVSTLLMRLLQKGYATSEKTRVPHVFRPDISKESLLAQRLDDLADELTEGIKTPLMQALVSNARLSEDEIAQLRALLDRAESDRPPKGATS